MTTALHITKKAFSTAVVGMTILWSVGASAVINPLVAAGAAVPVSGLVSGDLVMTDGAKSGATVYLYSGAKRYPFPNQKVYASWYGNDFSKVKRISSVDMGSLAWGDNMLYRPGSRLIKVPDDPKVYAVLPGGKVAWVKDEAAAAKFYGTQWAKRVDDLLASLFVASYTNDPTLDLTATTQYPAGTLVKVEVASAALSAAAVKYYYIEAGKKREVPEASLAQFRIEYAVSVTEADIASLTAGTAVGSGEFVNPVAVQEGTTVPGATGPAPAPTGGAVTVSLAADSPSARIFDGSALNPVLKLDLKAGSAAASVTSLKLTKRGGATNANITGMRVVDGAGKRHGNVVSSINEDNTFTLSFPADPIVVPANGSETATVQLDFNTSNNGVDAGLSIASAADVGGATATGSFPVQGFLLDIKDGASIVTTITFDLDGPADNASVQMNAPIEVFNFTLRDTGSFEKSWFQFIDLYNNGSVTDADIKDFQLVAPNGDVLQTVQQKDKHVIFDLRANPYSMDKGATKSFKVKVTPVTGATRTIDLQLQNNYDLLVKGQTTAHYILATADGTGTNDSSYPVGDAAGYTSMTLASGSLTLDKAADSPTTNYAVGESDVVLGKFSVKATGEDHEIRQLGFAVYNTAASETPLAGSIFVKSEGQTLYSTAFAASMFTESATAVATTSITLSTYLNLKAGETKTLELIGSIGSTANSSDNYGANIDITQVKRMVTGDLADPSVSVVNTSARTVKAATLDITDVAMAASGSYKIVAGTNGALVGKYTVNASAGGEDARMNSFVVSLGMGGASGDAVTDWSNTRLYRVGDDGTETLLQTSNNTDTGAATLTYTFTTPQVVSKADSDGIELRLRANLAGTGVSAQMISRFTVHASSADVVGNVTGNSVTEVISGQGTGINTVTGGTLKIALDTTVAPAINALVNVGQTDYTLGAVTLKAEDETQKVTGLQVWLEGTSSSTDVKNVRVYLDGAATALVAAVSMLRDSDDNGANIIWLSPDKLFEIESGQTRKLKFVADVGATGVAKIGNDIRLDVDESWHVTSTGKFTNTAASRTLLSENSIIHTVQPFTVTVGEASPAYPASNIETNVSTGTLLAKFKLTNGGAVSITTTQFKIYNNGSCTFDSIAGAAGTEDCNARASVFSLKTSAENSDSTTNLVSTQNTYEAAGVINWVTSGSTTLASSNANLVTAGGRYRTFGIYISTTPDGYAAGSNWQFSVAAEGDVVFNVAESSLGYDGNSDGDQVDNIASLQARGKPSLPQVTDKTT